MKNTQLATALINAQADLVARALDDGYLRLYSGTQPANASTALSGQTLLSELRFADPCAPAASNGVLTFAAIDTAAALATGTATWFRCLAADGTTTVLDGSVGLTGDTPNLVLSDVALSSPGLVLIDAFTHTVAAATAGL